MPRNNQSIRMIAESLTEDPDYYRDDPRYFTDDADEVLTEAISEALFGLLGGKKAKHPLTQLIKPGYVQQLAKQQFRGDTEAAMTKAVEDITLEFKTYCRYNKLPPDEFSQAEFIAYKQGKKLPHHNRDDRNMDDIGGADFRSGGGGDRVSKYSESRRRGRRGILK